MAGLWASQRAPGVFVFGVADSVAAFAADSEFDLGRVAHDAGDDTVCWDFGVYTFA